MSIHLTRIYTRTGDSGTTALGDFSRVPKSDVRVVAYADCDETNAALGVVAADRHLPAELVAVIAQLQNDLFDVGADLSAPRADDEMPGARLRITQPYIDRLEAWCDRFNEPLAALDSFILPGGTAAAAHLHVARTIARRAERSAWDAIAAFPGTTNPLAATYLNRLSDLLFILSRTANNGDDVKWVPGGAAGIDAAE